jgi:hypothetical protein
MNQPVVHAPPVASRTDGRETVTVRGGGFTGLLWLTWRQHRWALIGSLALAAVVTGWLAYLSADMTTLFHECGDQVCASGTVQDAALSANSGPFRIANDLLQFVMFLPLLIGMFLGVPLLAREHEQRTLLLAWSQDVSPTRWLWTKTVLLGAVVAALTAALSAVSDHALHVMATVNGSGLFDTFIPFDSGPLPLALGVSWLAVGAALGAATRRLLPAAITVLVGYVSLYLLVEWRYPTLMTPVSRFFPVAGPASQAAGMGSNALVVKGGTAIGPDQVTNLYNASGHPLDYGGLLKLCPDLAPTRLPACMADQHLRTLMEYQPSSRIPDFQLILATGYLGIGALAVVALWLIVRRTSLSAG